MTWLVERWGCLLLTWLVALLIAVYVDWLELQSGLVMTWLMALPHIACADSEKLYSCRLMTWLVVLLIVVHVDWLEL